MEGMKKQVGAAKGRCEGTDASLQERGAQKQESNKEIGLYLETVQQQIKRGILSAWLFVQILALKIPGN